MMPGRFPTATPGAVTGAARAVLAAAFATDRRRVRATVRPRNVVSLQVLGKFGGIDRVRATSDAQGEHVRFVCRSPEG
jgi:RimJ/RimL family protein N-acetyltransferase